VKPEPLTYIRYYKPAGYITTMDDEKGRKTIYDILPEEVQNLKPVGRLDKDSTGLLILTNDGDFINDLAHPSVHVPKIYRVCAQGKLTLNDLVLMEKGIEIEKGQIAYALSRIIDFEGKNTVLEIVLHQGLNRQIRKMCDACGLTIMRLTRISIGSLKLGELERGKWRDLTPEEVAYLSGKSNKI
jgi:23S rRNA pseudouridine2605 synthase